MGELRCRPGITCQRWRCGRKVGVMSSAEKKGSAAPKSTAEWVSLSISLVILLGFVAAILWLWIHQPTGPPQFKIERAMVRNDAGVFYLPVTVTNIGGLAVGQVRVEGKLSNTER